MNNPWVFNFQSYHQTSARCRTSYWLLVEMNTMQIPLKESSCRSVQFFIKSNWFEANSFFVIFTLSLPCGISWCRLPLPYYHIIMPHHTICHHHAILLHAICQCHALPLVTNQYIHCFTRRFTCFSFPFHSCFMRLAPSTHSSFIQRLCTSLHHHVQPWWSHACSYPYLL